MLFLIFSLLFSGIFVLFFLKKKYINLSKFIALFITSLVLFLSTLVVVQFDNNSYHLQNIETYSVNFNVLNITYSFGLDGISLFFFYLSSLLIFLCVLFIWNDILFKEYAINLILIELFLLIIFSALDLFFFYVFFEAILIPMFFIIGIWGSRERKIRAVFFFFFYTLCSSLLMLISMLYIYSLVGTLNLEYLVTWDFLRHEQMLLWIAFFISFSSKIPMFPFYIWLPEAHVEAPTVGSVLLAGILLKLGVYGFLRFSLTLYPEASLFFSPAIYLLSIIGIIFTSMNAICQMDLKRIIAYSSIAHMNLVTLGIFSFNILGTQGAILQSISHGFVSSGLFFLIGTLYERYYSRFFYYFGGSVHMMPIYSIILFIFTMANIALPGTSSFVGEFLLLIGVYKINIVTCFISATGVIFCGIYSLWVYNRIIFGNLKVDYTFKYKDINLREFCILLPLLFLIFFMGVYPSFFSDFIHLPSLNLSFIII